MYIALSKLLHLCHLEEQRGRVFKVMIWSNEGASHNEGRQFLWGSVDPSASLSQLPAYFNLFWCKNNSMICTT